MFLVDPHIPILSTSKVPPQRADWWSPEVRKADQFEALPAEIFNSFVEGVSGLPMSWADAVEIREKLMAERGLLAKELNIMFEEVNLLMHCLGSRLTCLGQFLLLRTLRLVLYRLYISRFRLSILNHVHPVVHSGRPC
jgi:hypothetical protein